MLNRLRALFGAKPAPGKASQPAPQPPARPKPAVHRAHIFTTRFETETGFRLYIDEQWSTQDAEPRCAFTEDLGLPGLARDFVDVVFVVDEPQARTALAPLLAPADIDRVLMDGPALPTQVVILFDAALPEDAALRNTPRATYIGHFETLE
jgi:hypothetical protein